MKKSLIVLLLTASLFYIASVVSADNVGVTVTVSTPECSDGLDNDGDTFIDFGSDPGCDSSGDNDETDVVPECSDSADNDSDGAIDFPADPGCDSSSDDSEVNSAGGGGAPANFTSQIIFSGYAYPGGKLDILKNGLLESESYANGSGNFSVELNVIEGEYTFVLIAYDSSLRSKALSFTVNLIANSSTEITGIKFEDFKEGEYTISSLGRKGDLNVDNRVNLIDFSIAAFWWKRSLSHEFSTVEKDKLNGDGIVDIYDFSIMAFYWTG